MFTGFILEKVEDAWKNFLDASPLSGSYSGSIATTVYKGIDNVDKIDASSIICSANSEEQIEYGINIYRVNFSLIYRYCPENEYETDINERNATVKLLSTTIFNDSNIVTNLEQQTTDLKIIDIEYTGGNNSVDEVSWMATLQFEMICTIHQQ